MNSERRALSSGRMRPDVGSQKLAAEAISYSLRSRSELTAPNPSLGEPYSGGGAAASSSRCSAGHRFSATLRAPSGEGCIPSPWFSA